MSQRWVGRKEKGLVRLYFAPILWLIMGVLVLASQAYTGSSRFRARVSSERLAAVQKANSRPFMTVVELFIVLLCTYSAIRALIGGVGTWWLWFMAAAAQFGVVALPTLNRDGTWGHGGSGSLNRKQTVWLRRACWNV